MFVSSFFLLFFPLRPSTLSFSFDLRSAAGPSRRCVQFQRSPKLRDLVRQHSLLCSKLATVRGGAGAPARRQELGNRESHGDVIALLSGFVQTRDSIRVAKARHQAKWQSQKSGSFSRATRQAVQRPKTKC